MRRFLLIGMSGAALAGLAAWWCLSGAVQTRGGTADAEQIVPVPHAPFSSHASDPSPSPSPLAVQAFFDHLVIAPCNLAPITEQDVSSQVDGIFEDIRVDLGQPVGQGALLGQLDD